MSMADYDDIYQICCNFDPAEQLRSKKKNEVNQLATEEVTDSLLPCSEDWWEVIEKDILEEEKKIFV
ncbi:hypothetical protein BIV60_21195 [Bacillus sp. MUM 116]|uniref:Uncharacterized protein n=1 Tax=Bacillus xiapuensis TaxID=2014075 RepID=A0ABU6N6Q4_9BACI|nr:MULTISPECIES: hypothetical protein [Bacillus]MED3561567.1 hypothetical protein [Bacillus xiapuensis]OIK10369.1 hypothetical protein BIV60_21195 [Bacillus sp. MUM 116]